MKRKLFYGGHCKCSSDQLEFDLGWLNYPQPFESNRFNGRYNRELRSEYRDRTAIVVNNVMLMFKILRLCQCIFFFLFFFNFLSDNPYHHNNDRTAKKNLDFSLGEH